jgi:hypothetical protein
MENATSDKSVVNGRLFMQAVEVLQELKSNLHHAKTPSMSFCTDSTFALHFIAALPGTPAFTGEIKHGQRWYPPSQIE